MIGVEGWVPEGGDEAGEFGVFEAEFDGGAGVGFGAGVVDGDFVGAGGFDIEEPDEAVVFAGPVDEVGAVGGVAAAFDGAAWFAVAGGEHGDGELGVAGGDGALVDGVAAAGFFAGFAFGGFGVAGGAEDFSFPIGDGLLELGGEFGGFVVDGDGLAGVVDHVVEVALAIEAMGLGAGGDGGAPGGEEGAVGPVGLLVFEERGEVAAVEGFVADTGNAGEGEQGGEEVDGAGDLGDGAALGELGGPGDVADGADAAFVGLAFFAFHATGPAIGVGAVVGEVNDDGVFGEVVLFEAVEDAADIAVLVFEHGVGAAGLFGDFLGGLGGGLGDGFVFEAGPVGLGGGPGGVGGGEGDVAEEGFVFAAVDELEGAVGADIDDVAFGADHFAFVFEGGVEVFAPMAGGVAEVFVEAACHGVVGPLGTVVPFAEGTGGVTGGFEGVGEGFFVEVESFLAGGDAFDAASGVVAAGEELGAGGGTDGADEEAVEGDAGFGDGVDVGGGELGVAGEAVVTPAGVVGEEDDEVGGGGLEGGGEEEEEEEAHGRAEGCGRAEGDLTGFTGFWGINGIFWGGVRERGMGMGGRGFGADRGWGAWVSFGIGGCWGWGGGRWGWGRLRGGGWLRLV